jgi:ketosteroid isomerase-like protein
MSTDTEVRRASERFYSALNTMVNGNADPLSEVWSHSATVTTMHPIGGREVGWESVGGSWSQVAKMATDGKIGIEDQVIQIDGNMAYEVGTERGQMTLAGKEVPIANRVTNVYRRENGDWKMVHHHADISVVMRDVLRDAKAKS